MTILGCPFRLIAHPSRREMTLCDWRFIVLLLIPCTSQCAAFAQAPSTTTRNYITSASDGGVCLAYFPSRFQLGRTKNPMFVSACIRSAYTVDDLDLIVGYPTVDREKNYHFLGALRFASKGKHLRGLHAAFCDVDDAFVDKLAEYRTLERLDLGGSNVSTNCFKSIQILEKLNALSVHDCRIDNRFLEKLAACKGLECMSIGGTDITLSAVRGYMRDSSIKSLFAHGLKNDAHQLDLESNSVRILDLSFNNLSGCRVKNMPALQKMYIVDSVVDSDFVNDLSRLPQLAKVYALDTKLADKDIANLKAAGKKVITDRAAMYESIDPAEFDPSKVYSK